MAFAEVGRALARSLGPDAWQARLERLPLTEQHRRFLLRSVMLVIAVHIGLLITGYVTGYIIIGREGVSAQSVIFETWTGWDADNFLKLAEHGYQKEEPNSFNVVFLPLYPLAIKIVHFVVPSYFISGLLVSAVAATAAGFFIQVLMNGDGSDEEECGRGAWYLMLFPTAYFLVLLYSEGLFLALTMGSFVAARRRYWGWCGMAAALATFTRAQGVVLIPALIFEALHQHKLQAWRRAYWLVLAPTGIVAYLGLNWYLFDDPLRFLDIQREHWGHQNIWPWESVRESFEWIRDGQPDATRTQIYEFRLASVILTAGLLLAGLRWLRPSYQVFGWLNLLMITSVSYQISVPRYLLGIFPLMIVLARLGRSPSVHQVVLPTFAILMSVLFVIYATRFGF